MPSRYCLERYCREPAKYRGRCIPHSRNRERETHPNKAVYNSKRWKLLRRAVLRDDPFCRGCRAEGIETLATEVDHIKAIEDGGDPFSRANCQSLCRTHHSRKTRAEQTPG